MRSRTLVIVMGVSGCGKSTVGRALAAGWQLPFLEGDDLHSAYNVERMRAGRPLTDADRDPWLHAIARALQDTGQYPDGVVVSCSALRRRYRDTLRAAGPALRFLFLDISPEVAAARARSRHGHFMPAELIPSQFATLERPDPAETDVVTVQADAPVEQVLTAARRALSGR